VDSLFSPLLQLLHVVGTYPQALLQPKSWLSVAVVLVALLETLLLLAAAVLVATFKSPSASPPIN
jgi:hypothetical protein